jgi:RNA polymerase sigma-70 factor (ECF subfamily)
VTDQSDREIIEAFKSPGSKERAFNDLVRKYQERLYWHIRKIVIYHDDADDAIQNTFVKAWQNLSNFRAESSIYTWLFRIATNESLSLIRSRKKHQFHTSEDNDYEAYLAENLESDSYFDGDEAQLVLQKAILTLPEKQRLVFNMKYFDEMKYEDMAEILETSVGALKASYHHAVKKIEKYIKVE